MVGLRRKSSTLFISRGGEDEPVWAPLRLQLPNRSPNKFLEVDAGVRHPCTSCHLEPPAGNLDPSLLSLQIRKHGQRAHPSVFRVRNFDLL
ncbi:unnamed protein product [Rangifer tarandus platyrhynchus]|uniref:Uncharacterized protein n=1 Tax=Rangifer tarandus platyrhynchus TaxID=3082113 RepID=A0AC59YHN0_RANTA